MDLRHLFLRYSWGANLALLFAIAYVSAGAMNQSLANRVQARAEQPAVATALPAASPAYSPSADGIVTRDLFQAAATTEALAGGTAEAGGAIGATSLRLKLLGVMFYGEGSQSNIATIQNLQDQKSDVYRPGQEVAVDAKLVEIGMDRVLLERGDGRREELTFEEAKGGGGGEGSPARPRRGHRGGEGGEPTAGPAETSENPADGIQQVSDTEFRVSQTAIAAALGNMSNLMTQARIIPNFVGQGDERKVDGFRIFRIQPGSIFQSLGLADGDVIKSINGERMDSMEKGMTMLRGLVGQSRFTIELERQREPRTQNYQVQ
jgi:type II secretion system protein C